MSTTQNGPIPPPTPISEPDPNLVAAAEEEQERMSEALRDSQARYLLNRCIELNARLRELNVQ